jgi:hypothetical protein
MDDYMYTVRLMDDYMYTVRLMDDYMYTMLQAILLLAIQINQYSVILITIRGVHEVVCTVRRL